MSRGFVAMSTACLPRRPTGAGFATPQSGNAWNVDHACSLQPASIVSPSGRWSKDFRRGPLRPGAIDSLDTVVYRSRYCRRNFRVARVCLDFRRRTRIWIEPFYRSAACRLGTNSRCWWDSIFGTERTSSALARDSDVARIDANASYGCRPGRHRESRRTDISFQDRRSGSRTRVVVRRNVLIPSLRGSWRLVRHDGYKPTRRGRALAGFTPRTAAVVR